MYNFNFLKNEELREVFDDVWIAQGKSEKCTTIALTNQRLLFLDYDKLDPRENLRVGRGVDYARFKEVYYSIDLKSIKSVSNKEEIIIIVLSDGYEIEIENVDLFKLIKKEIDN